MMLLLQVTAHNHAGSATRIYQFITLDTLGAPTLPRGGLASVLSGLGFRASISILISVLCLVLASLGVCFCIRKSEFLVIWKKRKVSVFWEEQTSFCIFRKTKKVLYFQKNLKLFVLWKEPTSFCILRKTDKFLYFKKNRQVFVFKEEPTSFWILRKPDKLLSCLYLVSY